MLFCIRHFSQTINFSKIFYPKIDLFLHHCSWFFMTFSASIFSSIFDAKWLPKWSISILCAGPFGSFFATFFEDRFLDAFWSPFGSLWAPFWLPLALFGLPFGSLWLPLAHFWLPLAPFGSHFCSFWLTFCSFWLTFTPFSHFGRLLASFLVPFRYFQRKSNEKSCFSMFFSEFSTLLRTRFRKALAD